ncbi:hypothetical protein MASR2M74_29030 [Paracoccaceae bacterium]
MMPALTLRSALLLTALCALSACGDKGERAAPVPLAASGPSEVKVEGVSYLADLQPTETGSTLRITRAAPDMTYDEGALAKQVGVQFCSGRGKRLAPWALGKFDGGAWVFDGGCA